MATRVLGVSTPDIETELLPIWSAAKDSIDNQIGEFQNMLRKVGGDTAIEIADHGLGGLAGRWNVRLMAALLQYDDHDGANRGAVAQSLLKACQMTRNEVTANPVLAMLERNPFGVAITIRAVINRAISKLRVPLMTRSTESYYMGRKGEENNVSHDGQKQRKGWWQGRRLS